MATHNANVLMPSSPETNRFARRQRAKKPLARGALCGLVKVLSVSKVGIISKSCQEPVLATLLAALSFTPHRAYFRMNPSISTKLLVLVGSLAGLATLLAGCSGSNEHNLVGTWQYRGRLSPLEAAGNDAVPGADTGAAAPGITLQFSRGGKLRTETHQGSIHTVKEGTWTWLHYDPVSHVGAIQCRLLDQKTDHRLEFVGPDAIRLSPPNLAGIEQQLLFQRQR